MHLFFSGPAATNLFLIGLAAPASTVMSIIMLLLYIQLNRKKLAGTISE